MQNANENLSLSERINGAVQKNRTLIFVTLGILAAALIGVIATLSIMDVFRKKAIAEVEELSRRYETLRFTITEDASAEDVKTLQDDLNVFAKKASGYPGGRAWYIIGSIHAAQDEWADAEAAWKDAAKTGAKTWLAPLALFDAASAAEKQGKNQEAVELYTESLSTQAAFPAASRAQFSIGRLREGLNEKDAAIEAYRAVTAQWPNDEIWAKLAHSRIIALEAGLR